MLHFRDEHRWNAMESRATLRLNGFQHAKRVESSAGKNHSRSVRHASQRGHYHAKTVIERNGNAQPVALAQSHRFSNKECVVQNIVMTECCPFRRSCGPAGELNIDRI